jgi:chromate transporter
MAPVRPTLRTIAAEWVRIGCLGFGGPPTHIKLLRDLCVERRSWIDAVEFEDALAACNLLPGPASTQLAIFCAWRIRGRLGAVTGGLAFILPGLVAIIALAAVFLSGRPPEWIVAAAAGAGAAVAAVATNAATALLPASWRRARAGSRLRVVRWTAYVASGGIAAAMIGPWLVLVLLGCGTIEACWQHPGKPRPTLSAAIQLLTSGAITTSVLASISWMALKVGALSYGGGFVIVPLMQADAVTHYHWMTSGQFLNAVALGQITPGPVVQTVAVVGYAAAGIAGAGLASLIAFAPSFAFILLGGRHFDRLRGNRNVRAFLDGAGPCAVGAILGSAVTLARALTDPWQYVVLGVAAVLLLVLRRGVVPTLLASAGAGVVVAAAGVAIPH